MRLSWESKFVPFDGWTLILRKMAKRKAFLAKPKHQNCVSQWKEHVLVSNHKKNRDYDGNQVCPFWWMNFDFKENDKKKSFSCKNKASKPCIPMKKTCLSCPITKKIEIMTRIHVCPFWWMNLDFKENDRTKSFSR